MGSIRQLAGHAAIAVAACWAALNASAAAAAAFTYQNDGVVGPSVFLPVPPGSPLGTPRPCPPPPALPIDCDLTALGAATVIEGDVLGPWSFASVFSISPTFAVTGWFGFLDLTPANNNFVGTLSGNFDPTVFRSVFDYTVTSGSGVFAIGRWTGSGVVQVIPGVAGFSYTERGSFQVPEPGSLGLLAAAMLSLALVRCRRPR